LQEIYHHVTLWEKVADLQWNKSICWIYLFIQSVSAQGYELLNAYSDSSIASRFAGMSVGQEDPG